MATKSAQGVRERGEHQIVDWTREPRQGRSTFRRRHDCEQTSGDQQRLSEDIKLSVSAYSVARQPPHLSLILQEPHAPKARYGLEGA